MEKTNQHIKDFCEVEFSNWLASRRHYLTGKQMNVLAQFMPSKASVERDHLNSPLCAAFYLALLLEIDRDIEKATCFLYVYFPKYKPQTLKAHLHLDMQDKVTVQTAIRWAHDTAERIYHLAQINVKLTDMMKSKDFAFN
jgi:hypothetical protein